MLQRADLLDSVLEAIFNHLTAGGAELLVGIQPKIYLFIFFFFYVAAAAPVVF